VKIRILPYLISCYKTYLFHIFHVTTEYIRIYAVGFTKYQTATLDKIQ